MAEINNKKCGCKGVRSCLVCELGRGDTASEPSAEQAIQQYQYCHLCEKAWPETERSSSSHPHHQGEALEFSGILLLLDFVTSEEEQAIVAEIDKTAWAVSQSGRRKQDYGPKANFKKKKLKTGCFTGLPAFSASLVARLADCACPVLDNFQPVELCNLEYIPSRGSSIDPHFDDFWLWGDRLVTLNLLSHTTLSFTHPGDDGVAASIIEVKVGLPPRSLVVVWGAARSRWKHGIHREDIVARRVAVTLRELTPEFAEKGPNEHIGKELLDIALTFNGVAIGS